jgi:hypothetical protein
MVEDSQIAASLFGEVRDEDRHLIWRREARRAGAVNVLFGDELLV